MSKILSDLGRICLCTLGFSSTSNSITLAQVTSDNTVNTQVTQNGNVAEITGGETRGSNLFHSFQDFSVTTGNQAFFNNANEIGNIFSRVTGGNVSNIDGMISANGSANLFLINPAGIMFGENASLNIGGSFYGSSASSILFENGEFSTDLDNPPLLTVNAPIGLGFRDNPGGITANQAFLEVPVGETLALLGGNLNFDGGSYGAIDGRLELGGLTEAGTVNIDDNGSFSFPQAVARGDVAAAAATFLVAGGEGGSVGINANNLSLTAGSSIFNGILSDSGTTDTQAGDVVINLTEDLIINNSNINNSIFGGTGNSGNVVVNARSINFSNGGLIFIFNNGSGNIGDTTLTVTEDITFDGIAGNQASGVSYFVAAEATGNNGEINLTAQNLDITNGAAISNNVAANSNSGDINLNISDTILVEGSGFATGSDGTQSELNSDISSNVADGNGNSGSININAQNLLIREEGFISSLNAGEGNAGNIDINVNSLSITEGGQITGDIRGSGQGGNITINAQENVSIIGNSDLFSTISADIEEGATGEAGNIEINTPSLVLDDSFISADVFGEGNGGLIEINTVTTSLSGSDQSFISADVVGTGNAGSIRVLASESVELSNSSLIQSNVLEDATGNAGDVTIETTQLNLTNGSQVSASTQGNGNAGNVTITASESIILSGTNEDGSSGVFASAVIESGNGGDINLTTDQLTISEGAVITAGNLSILGTVEPGTGEPGNINIVANNLNLESGGSILATTQAETGTGAEINLEVADSIFLSGDSFISAQAFGNANGGNLTIDTNFIVAFEGNNDILASAEQGEGGNINITAESLLGITAGTLNPFTNDINASSEFGLDGSVSLDVPDVNSVQGETELSINILEPGSTTAQVCDANRAIAAQNSLVITGKGGVPAAPEMPLNSANIIINGSIANSQLPQPIATSKGQIQPARGIKLTEKGKIILTAYRTNNQGDRLPNIQTSCS